MFKKELNIFIVDSCLSSTVDLQMKSESLGHQVVGKCGNAFQAVRQIRKLRPDLILLDVEMVDADLSGLAIAEKIRFLCIPVIFMTPFGREKDFETAKTLNMIGFLQKPIDRFSLMTGFHWALLIANQVTFICKQKMTGGEYFSPKIIDIRP